VVVRVGARAICFAGANAKVCDDGNAVMIHRVRLSDRRLIVQRDLAKSWYRVGYRVWDYSVGWMAGDVIMCR